MPVRIEATLPSPPDKVFRLWTVPEEITRWWGDDSSYRVKSWRSNLVSGGLWQAVFATTNGAQLSAGGAYFEIADPQRIGFTWCADWEPDKVKNIDIKIDPHEVGSTVVLASSGDKTEVERLADEQAWKQIVGWLIQDCVDLR